MPSLRTMKILQSSFWIDSLFAIDAAGQWNRSWVCVCGYLGGWICSPSCPRTDKAGAPRPRKPAAETGIYLA